MDLFMKAKCLLLAFLLCGISIAQSKYELKMKVKAASLDDKKQIVLYASGELEEFYDGYIVFPTFIDRIQGGMVEGGFSFLDYTGLDTYSETKKQLAKNKYPSVDLEVFSNGFDADKVLSFRIIPEFVDEKDDTVSLFIKYVLYDFNNEQVDYSKWDAKINLYNKLMCIPLNQESTINISNTKLSDYKLSLFVRRVETKTDLVTIENRKLFEEIKKAVKSCEPIEEEFMFDLSFGKSTKLSGEPYLVFSSEGETESSISLIDVESFNAVEFDSERVNLSNNIYHAKITTPFDIQNKAKAEKYETYSSKEKIFTSEYDVYFLPISVEGDSLIGELFISVKKLNLNDKIERWSQIHKKVKMKINVRNTNNISSNRYWASLIFQLPKENWSAFFTRSGEKYEIYGYSDYERFINEFINITLSLEEEKK